MIGDRVPSSEPGSPIDGSSSIGGGGSEVYSNYLKGIAAPESSEYLCAGCRGEMSYTSIASVWVSLWRRTRQSAES